VLEFLRTHSQIGVAVGLGANEEGATGGRLPLGSGARAVIDAAGGTQVREEGAVGGARHVFNEATGSKGRECLGQVGTGLREIARRHDNDWGGA
jgi:hypothetical protein